MPDFSAQHLLPEEAQLVRPRDQARRFALPTVAAILLHAAAVGPLLWWTQAKPPEMQPGEIEISPMEASAPAEAAEPSDVTEQVQAAQPETAPPEAPPEAAPPPPPDAVQPPPPDNAPPPPPPPEAISEPPPPDAAPPEPVAPTPLIEPLAVEPLDSEDVLPPPPPEDALETPPPPPPPSRVMPEETVRAVAPPPPPPPPPPRPRPAAPPRPVAPEAPAAAPAAAPAPAAAAPAAPARPPASYVGLLMSALERHKEYPFSARSRRAEGTVVLRFAMRRDGSVASWSIARSSGHDDLDQAVAAMIRRASPLPAPPRELPGDPVELVVPVRFTLRP